MYVYCVHFVAAPAALASPLPILRMAAIGVGASKHVQGFDTSWPSLECNSFCRFLVFFQIDESGMLLTVMVLVPLTSCVKYTFLDDFWSFCLSLCSYSVLMGVA